MKSSYYRLDVVGLPPANADLITTLKVELGDQVSQISLAG